MPETSSAAELAAGDSLNPHGPLDHQEDRPGAMDPSLPSGVPPPFGQRKRREERLVKPDQWARWTHCQRPSPADACFKWRRVSQNTFSLNRKRKPLRNVFFFCFILKQNFDWLYLLK